MLHLLFFCQRPSFLLRPSFSLLPFPHSFILSLPGLSTKEDGGKRIIPILLSLLSFSLALSLPLWLSRSSRSTSEPAIRSLASLSLVSSREITDRCSSSVARADSSHRASRCEHQSLVKARLLVVDIPMREGGRSPQCVCSSNRDEKPPSVASRHGRSV